MLSRDFPNRFLAAAEPQPASDAIDMTAKAEKGIEIGGFCVRDFGYDAARRIIFENLRARRKLAVLFANAHFVTTCQNLRPQFDRHPRVEILNDGIGINLAAYLAHRHWFAENMNGTDFVPRLLQEAEAPLRLFLLGGSPSAVEGAARELGTLRHVTIAGRCDGYSFWSRQEAVTAAINESQADMVLVALGMPIQERWILENWRRIEAPVLMAVGALFDFLSHEQPRAPLWMRRVHLEWLFRLGNEPDRLFRRYTIGLVTFFRIVLAHRRERGG
jgi:beta-1,4-glucosyltransferase